MGSPFRSPFQLFLFFCLLNQAWVAGQELPPLTNFIPSQYNGGNQNWMISQGEKNHIFVANNAGLLEFDGEHWNSFEVPGGTAIRSVHASEGRIYTGSYMDFGYWELDHTGKLHYSSLKEAVASAMIDGEQFWDIKELVDYVIFQSHQRLYSFNKRTGKVSALITEKNISNLFKVGNKIYYQVADKGLFVIENGKGHLFVSNHLIKNKPIIGLFPFADNKMLAITRDDGLFTVTGNQWEEFRVMNYPSSVSFFSSLYLRDGTLVLGSIGSGLYVLNLKDATLYRLAQPYLQNNTVLAVMEDAEGNIWGGLDNGLTVINRKSPFRLYVDTFGEIGTVYCSYVVDGMRYLGTNQGLYYKREEEDSYRLVPGTTGQVWSINSIDGELYMGHDRGTFLIKGTSAVQTWDGLGTWTIKKLGSGILQGHYDGLTYRAHGAEASSATYLKGFDLSSRNILVENDTVVWIAHYHKGIFRLELSNDHSEIEKSENYPVQKDSGLGPQLFTFNGQIYYSTEKDIFRYDKKEKKFTSQNELSQLTRGHQRISGISEVLNDGTWWAFGKDNLYVVSRDAFERELVLQAVPLPKKNWNITKGFENISLIGKDRYLVGSNVGYIEFSLPLEKFPMKELSLTAVKTAAKDKNFVDMPIEDSGLDLKNELNNVNFYFSVPGFQKLANTQYRYRVLNYSPSWSKWEESGTAEFENLPSGSYTFQVKGRVDGEETEILSFPFAIAPPWYLSTMAFFSYALLFLMGLVLIHTGYRRYHEKLIRQREKNLKMKALEAEQKIIKLQKEHLERDMAEKNGQLAASTMTLIKKNEFLSALKEKLKNVETSKVTGVIKTIDREISDKDNWEMFQEAFRNADKDFFNKIKSKHPELTSNDLRLCAYLRLNLSSKEIAPLINISVKSVEIKRYRLRKKMNLPREINLTDYIINL